MDTHDSADIASKVATTGSDCEILCRTQAVSVDHEVAVVLVYRGRFGSVTGIEELWESASLDRMNFVTGIPGSIARDNNFMSLGCQVLASLILETKASCLELGRIVVVGSGVYRVVKTVSHEDIWAPGVIIVIIVIIVVVVVRAEVGRYDTVELAVFANIAGLDGDEVGTHGRSVLNEKVTNERHEIETRDNRTFDRTQSQELSIYITKKTDVTTKTIIHNVVCEPNLLVAVLHGQYPPQRQNTRSELQCKHYPSQQSILYPLV